MLEEELLPDLNTEFVFDRYAISKELMKVDPKNPFAAPDSVVQRNIATLHHWLEIWGYNMSLNAPAIMEDFGVDIHTRKPSRARGTESASCSVTRPDLMLIVGSGPSLERHLTAMRSWPGIVVCSPTNMLALLAHGITPHYCMAVDSSPVLGIHLKQAALVPGAERCKLLLPVTADPQTVLAWPHERYWHLDFIQGGRGLNNPFNVFQVNIFPYISFWLTQAGNVVNSAVMLPLTWGNTSLFDIKKVFLFGVDCGFPGNVARIPFYKYVDGEFQRHEPASVDFTRSSPLIYSKNGTPTEEAQLGYKRSLATVWWATFYRAEVRVEENGKQVAKTLDFDETTRRPGMYHLYSCSEGILEDTIPHEDGAEVLRSAGACAKPYTRADVDAAYKRYMRDIAPFEKQGEEEDAKT